MWNRTESLHDWAGESLNVVEPLESRQMFSVALLGGVDTSLGLSASSHTGGVNVAMGDGSVRFVSDSITTTIYR